MVFSIIILPILGSIAVYRARTERSMRLRGIWAALVTFILSVVLWLLFDNLKTKSKPLAINLDSGSSFDSNPIYMEYLNTSDLWWFGDTNIPLWLSINSKKLLFVILCISLFTLMHIILSQALSKKEMFLVLFTESLLIMVVWLLEISAYLHFLAYFDYPILYVIFGYFMTVFDVILGYVMTVFAVSIEYVTNVLAINSIMEEFSFLPPRYSLLIWVLAVLAIGIQYFQTLVCVSIQYALLVWDLHMAYIMMVFGGIPIWTLIQSNNCVISLLITETLVVLRVSALDVTPPAVVSFWTRFDCLSDWGFAFVFCYEYKVTFWFYLVLGLIVFLVYFITMRSRLPLCFDRLRALKRLLDAKYGSVITPCIFFLAIQLQALFICITYLEGLSYDPFVYFCCWTLYYGYLAFYCWYWYYFVSTIFWSRDTIVYTTYSLVASADCLFCKKNWDQRKVRAP